MSDTAGSNRQIVPLANPLADSHHLKARLMDALERVLDSGAYLLGPEVQALERDFPAFVGVAEGVGVASGTDALALALQAAGVCPGDEVITVSHTAGPTVAAIYMTGALPVLVDIEEDTYCLDPAALDGALSTRTKAVLPVHLYGHPADMNAILAYARRQGLAVIEDCAQAHDARIGPRRVGSIGDLGCFSFYPTKNLGAVGDGGMVVGDCADLIDRLRQLRTYGWRDPQYSELEGGRGSRLGELQAAILNVKLTELEQQVDRRRALADRYREGLGDLPLTLPTERPECRHAYHLYVVRHERRDALAEHLKRAGVLTGRHYPYPLHRQPGLSAGATVPAPLRRTEAVVDTILTLPLFTAMTAGQQDQVIDAIRTYFEK